jgi:hypothetical protein
MPPGIPSLSGETRMRILLEPGSNHFPCAQHRALMTKGQVLLNPINIGWPEDFGFPQRPPALGIFAFHQMAFACAPEKDFAGAGNLETLFH